MAFGIKRQELNQWKQNVLRGEIAYLTHYWLDNRYPGVTSVTKVGCADIIRLQAWCVKHKLPAQYIHNRDPFPHFDLIGSRQRPILEQEGQWEQIKRFNLI
ncbi:hypothetical protein [Paenibacillus taiwanensis]|uniref:hypothetical protein n=1 Tax=Paenibacillus taiwanensis TaxID=401638 RepID=UPI00048FDF84|nr:hypothetical protein [Paenibacillus taiwanensis]